MMCIMPNISVRPSAIRMYIEPMLSPMTALWTSSEAVMNFSRGGEGRLRYCMAPSASNRRPVANTNTMQLFDRNCSAACPAISAIGWRQLRHQSRNPVLHLGEGHGVDDLVGDAVVILPPIMSFAPEIIELDTVQGLGDLLRIETLSLLYRRDKSEGGIGEVDARCIPLAVLLGVARLPALDCFGQRILDVAMHPHALDVRLASDVRHHRGVDLPDVNEAPLETEFTRLLDDQADTACRRCVHANDVRFLRQDAQQDRVEVGNRALEELLRRHLIPLLLDEIRLDLDRPPAGVIVRRDRGHGLDLGMVL